MRRQPADTQKTRDNSKQGRVWWREPSRLPGDVLTIELVAIGILVIHLGGSHLGCDGLGVGSGQ